MSGQGTLNMQGQHNVSFNWHGSLPTVRADEAVPPNFRQFDFFLLDEDAPNVDLVERVFKVEDGKAHWNLKTVWSPHIRAAPVVVTTMFSACMVNYMYTRFLSRTAASLRLTIVPIYGMLLFWNNFTKYYSRERHFTRDWQRNQHYAFDEMRDQRDKQRVREALYEKNFAKNPLAEYRIKAWELGGRFA